MYAHVHVLYMYTYMYNVMYTHVYQYLSSSVDFEKHRKLAATNMCVSADIHMDSVKAHRHCAHPGSIHVLSLEGAENGHTLPRSKSPSLGCHCE